MKSKVFILLILGFLSTRVLGQVTTTGDSSIGCSTPCTSLTAHLIGDVPTDCSIGMDDIYSSPFSLGFTFDFYGTSYTQVLVGANGNLSFDLALAGSYDPWPISAALLGNSSVYNCICGPWCDIDYADYGGSCWYSLDGTAPNRKFVVTFCKCYMYTSTLCPGQYTTTQIILYETTNNIEVHIGNKTICTSWNGGHAICGVQNATGTAATAAPSRDWTPNWSVSDEAWRFVPTGGGTSYTVSAIPYAPVPLASSQIYWFDSSAGTFIDTGLTVMVCPTVTTTYRAGALGCESSGSSTTAADTSYSSVVVTVNPCSMIVSGNQPCPGDSILLVCTNVGSTSGTITYAWTGPGGFSSTSQNPFVYPSNYSDTGTYRLVRTISGAHDTGYVHITFNPKPTLVVTNNGPFCSNIVSTLNLTASPDSVGETFAWTGPGTFTSTLENPSVTPVVYSDTGLYEVIATNRYGCKDTGFTDVSMNTPPTLSVDSLVVKTCVGIPVDLHIYATPSGFYNYTWTPSTGLSSTTIFNPVVDPMTPGDVTYTVDVALPIMPGCFSQDTIHVHTVPNDFTLENPDTVICRGQSVQVRVSGGSPEFTWLWSPTLGVSNVIIPTPTIFTTITQTYSLTASYAHCPNMVHGFTITVDTPAIPVTILDSICLTQSQNVNLTFPGSGFYNYTWAPATYLSSSSSATVSITPTVPGDYTYDVSVSPGTAPVGCTITDVVKLHVAPIDFTLSNEDTVICRGQYVQANVTGSTDFIWLWQPTTGVSDSTSPSPVVTPTVTTVYTVTAIYPGHCTADKHSFKITVDTPAVPEVIHDTICLGMTDNVNLTFPGSGFYHYSWNPTAFVSDTTAAIVALTPTVTGDDNYTITVYPGTNPPGCSIIDQVILHVAPNDFILGNDDTAICLGQSIQAIVTGSSEFKYFWTPAMGVSNATITDPSLTPTVSTTYTVTATYAPHCPDMMHHFYIEVDTLAHPITITDTICLATADSVNLAFQNSNTYSFTWIPTPPALNTYLSDSLASVVAILPTVQGTYNWAITVSPRALNCSVNDAVNLLVVPNSFTISPTVDTVCLGTEVQVLGNPYPLFSYQWVPTNGIPVSNIINPLILPDTNTTYIVTAYFRKCPLMVDTLQMYVEPNPTVYLGGYRFQCQYDTGHIIAQVTPQWYNYYAYSWSPASSFNVSNTQSVVYIDSMSREISCTVTTPHGCKGSDSTLVTIYPGNFLAPMPDVDFCPGDSAILTAFGAVKYLWQPPLYLSDTNEASTMIHPLSAMTYSVIGTSANGCKDTVSFNVDVHPSGVIFMPDSVTLYPGQKYQMDPQTNCTSFQWSPTFGLDNSVASNPNVNVDMTVKYFLTASTEWGCSVTDSIIIRYDPNSNIAFPNVFRPGSGTNSQFKILLNGIASVSYFRIYNRWGELLFETTNINEGWDGNYKGAPQPFGVYVYIVDGVTSTGVPFTRQGNVTLMR